MDRMRVDAIRPSGSFTCLRIGTIDQSISEHATGNESQTESGFQPMGVVAGCRTLG